MRVSGQERRFLFLQGPHGPFFRILAKALRQSGAQVWRVGFNFGDQVLWGHHQGYIGYRGPLAQWPQSLSAILAEKSITDIVLYGDTRAIHAQAIQIAKAAGLTIHVFEEGYLRPYWVTYERGGSNGNSALMQMTIDQMRQSLSAPEGDMPEVPARWGDMRHHVFWGAVYHWFVMICFWDYKGFRPHRKLTVVQEFRLYLRKLALLPYHAVERFYATWRVSRGGFPYHLVLLQLEHDASFRDHSPYSTMADFIAEVTEAFAQGAPDHHHLVFKAHPLEDGRVPLRRLIRENAQRFGLKDRTHFVRGGKLAALLNAARSAVTVNSTAGQQALWRNMPLKAFGRAVYDKPELVSGQTAPAFFAQPQLPDASAYRVYRQFLQETSQIAGGFYSRKGRDRLLENIAQLMLSAQAPYQRATPIAASLAQHLPQVR